MSAKSYSVEQLTDEQLQCRDYGHRWSHRTDKDLIYYRSKLVQITRESRCDRGCGVWREEDLEVPSFKRIGQSRLHYPAGYQMNVQLYKEDFRRAWYDRHPPQASGGEVRTLKRRRRASA